jgi:ABC-type multidrug transport system fused ATPase/permease subunit
MLTKTISQLWQHIETRRKIQLSWVALLTLGGTLAEIISIGSVVPFLAALVAPEKLLGNPYAEPLVNFLNIESHSQLMLSLTILFVVATLSSTLIRLMLLVSQSYLGQAIGNDLSIAVYKKILNQPYPEHISLNTSQLVSGIVTKVGTVIYALIIPMMSSLSSIAILISVFIGLVILEPVIIISIFLIMLAIYMVIYKKSKNRLAKNSMIISKESSNQIQAMQEAFGGIRDIILDGTQSFFINVFKKIDVDLRRAQASNQIIASFPRLIVEALGMIVIAVTAYIFIRGGTGVTDMIPFLGLVALSAQRLLPLVQSLYAALSGIKGGITSANDILKLLEQKSMKQELEILEKIKFDQKITIRDLSFQYNTTAPWVLQDLNLEIKKGTCIGIIGKTGSGKSTILDILMALTPCRNGALLIDDEVINEHNARRWQAHIAHVPQTIYLADTSVKNNIAFGIDLSRIDMARVQSAAMDAQIHETIMSWDEGYETRVGEKGLFLSGGQRQRIGIARALYKQASLLILDEATNALDNQTEIDVLNAIKKLNGKLTVLIVTHNMTTLKDCDSVYEIKDGKIKEKRRELMKD